MKTIGMLGGMSWESTLGYYQAINTGVKEALGGLHSAKIALQSVDFHEIEQLQHAGDWGGTAAILCEAAKGVEAAGADFLIICTNTNAVERAIVHRVIYEELCLGKTIADSKAEYLRIVDALANQGAEAVILGCTEIGMLIGQEDTDVRLLDTTSIHAAKAVAYATS